MGANTENRRGTRYSYEEEVEFLAPRQCKGIGVDLATGGIGAIVPEPFPEGAQVQMKILGGRIIVQGTVRWCREDNGQHRIGIQFTEEDWSVLEKIQALQDSA